MPTVAFLGVGTMGAPMATRLAAAQHELVVWNRTRAKAATINGATVADTPASAAAGADIVITMLATPAAVESVLFGADGVVAALTPGSCLVEMSTIGPHPVAEIARRLPAGVGLVDAPVGGSIGKATDGTLTLFAGGTDADVDRVAPVLAELGTLLRCGGSGAGAATKLVVNTALITGIALLDEVLTLADQLEVPAALADQVLAAGPLGALLARAKDTATSQFTADLAVKDLALAIDHATGDLPHTAAALDRLRAAAPALGTKDFGALAPTSGRGLPNRTPGERDASQPQVRDQTRPSVPNATRSSHSGEAGRTTFHNPPTAPPPAAAYSNIADVDLGGTRLLILSGQAALAADGTVVGGDDLRAQTTFVFDAIGALLADRGATFADVVNIRSYLTDMARLREYGAVRQSYLDGHEPTSTTVEVSRLFRPGLLLEVDVTAVVRPGGTA